MDFDNILFNLKGNYYSSKSIIYKSVDTIVFPEISSDDSYVLNSKHGLIGYFLVKEENGDVSGIRRFLKPDLRMKKSLKVIFVDHISDDIRDIYGEYIEIVSKFVGLKKVVNSFCDLIEQDQVINMYDRWLENTVRNVNSTYRDNVAQKVTKFVNLYLIGIYERLYGKNLGLLREHESEIVYKILETSLMQRTL